MTSEPQWHNPPPAWTLDGSFLEFTTGPETDFWNRTFYGFKHANGHFLAHAARGDFTAHARFSARYEALYDQAGIMLMVDGENWIKTGIEYTDGAPHLSVVVTRDDQSDWSVIPMPTAALDGIDVRLTRHGGALRVQYRQNGPGWAMARLGFLDMPEMVEVGPMACSPVGPGLEVRFSKFEIGPAISRDLHADDGA